MDFRAWRRLKESLEAAIVEREEFMSGGGCETFEAYRESVGFLNGLRHALQELEEATKDEAA